MLELGLSYALTRGRALQFSSRFLEEGADIQPRAEFDEAAEGFQAQIDSKFPPFPVETAGHKLRCGAVVTEFVAGRTSSSSSAKARGIHSHPHPHPSPKPNPKPQTPKPLNATPTPALRLAAGRARRAVQRARLPEVRREPRAAQHLQPLQSRLHPAARRRAGGAHVGRPRRAARRLQPRPGAGIGGGRAARAATKKGQGGERGG